MILFLKFWCIMLDAFVKQCFYDLALQEISGKMKIDWFVALVHKKCHEKLAIAPPSRFWDNV